MANVHEHIHASNEPNSGRYLPLLKNLHRSLDFIVDGFVRISAPQAQAVLDQCRYEFQRKIDDNHVSVLRDMMVRGQWMDRDKLDFAKVGDKLVLVNGYHRLTAQSVSGKKIEWTIVIHECANEAEIKRLYWMFDTNTRRRSAEQILTASGLYEALGVAKTVARGVFRAVPFIQSNLSCKKDDRDILSIRVMDRRLKIAMEFAAEARAFDKAIKPAATELKAKMLNAGVTAVALLTFRYQPEKAAEFWGEAAKNDGLRSGDARNKFVMDLLARDMKKGNADQAVAPAISCWNAFFAGRSVKNVRVAGRAADLAGAPKER